MDHNLKQVLMPLVVIGTFGWSILLFTRTITEYILRKKMIEKGFVNEESQSIFKKQSITDNKYASLKWGLILFFAGLSLIIMEYVPHNPQSPLPYGMFGLAISLGFLIYYFLVKRDSSGLSE